VHPERRPDAGDAGATALVDVGIPTYRRPRFLSEAVDSVLSQTFDRWRLFISEDGPGTGEVAAAVEPYLRDARIHFSTSGARQGPPGNKNALLRAGSAPYVAILDDDDRWHPALLARRVSFLEDHPECGFVFSASYEIDDAGNRLRKTGFFGPEGVVTGEAFAVRLLQGYFVRPASLLVRRSAYDAVGASFDETLQYIYDADMWLRIALRFPVGYLADADSDHRIHHGQDSFGVRASEQYLRFLDRAEALVDAQPWAAAWSRRDRSRVRSSWLLSASLDSLEQDDRRSAAARLRRALQLHARHVFDGRAAAALAGVLLGRRAGRAIGGAGRALARRQRWRRQATRPS
jgi:glycosyltransferase involved in cell wall biosynthesis